MMTQSNKKWDLSAIGLHARGIATSLRLVHPQLGDEGRIHLHQLVREGDDGSNTIDWIVVALDADDQTIEMATTDFERRAKLTIEEFLLEDLTPVYEGDIPVFAY